MHSTTTNFNTKDTVVLYQNDTAIVTGNVPVCLNLYLPKEPKTVALKNSRFLLLLSNPQIITAPDGVYEIYLAGSKTASNELWPSQQDFVSLLNLYSFTAPGAKQQVEIDITTQLKKILSEDRAAPPYFATIKFAPIKLADGTFSTNAGKVGFTGWSVVELNN